jgi:diguanylate cyclase (GGDEF)-like protein
LVSNRWLTFLYTNKKTFIDLALILSLAALSSWSFRQFNLGHLIEGLEMSIYDLRFSLGSQAQTPSKSIALVVFDDDTMATYEHMYGTWPWSRRVHAQLIKYLHQAGARQTLFDIMFVGKGKDNKDKELVDAFLSTPNVYLGINLTYNPLAASAVSLNNTKAKPNQKGKSVNQATMPILPGFTLSPYDKIIQQHPDIDFLWLNNPGLNFAGYRPLLAGLMQKPERLGIINHLRDEDGISRGNPLLYKLQVRLPNGKRDTRFIPYLGLRAVLDLKHFDPKKDVLSLGQDNVLRWKDLAFPLNNQGILPVNWISTQRKPYTEIPAHFVISSILREQQGLPPTRADILLKRFFKDKTVFVGSTAVSTFDIKTTSVHRLFPGVTFQAVLYDNLLNGNQFVRRVGPVINTWLTGLLCLLGCFLLIKMRAALAGFAIAVALLASYVVGTQVLFTQYRLWLDLAYPMVYFTATVILTFTVKYMSRELDYRQTYKLATTDSLTSLYNHRYFMEQANHLVEQAKDKNGRFSLILVDIDHFKKFNDTYGHLIGDAVLRAVAQALKKNVRAIDVVARYGGEEMAILLARTSLDEALQVANKLVTAIGETKHNLGPDMSLTVHISAGVATYPQHGAGIMELIEHSDKGLYLAKGNGRNQVGLSATKDPVTGLPIRETFLLTASS